MIFVILRFDVFINNVNKTFKMYKFHSKHILLNFFQQIAKKQNGKMQIGCEST